ncbi:MAG: hypothetical protein ACYTG7_08470 [Planctomycetota bacterium]
MKTAILYLFLAGTLIAGGTVQGDQCTLYGFYFVGKNRPDLSGAIFAKNDAIMAVSYYTSGFDFQVSLTDGTRFEKFRTEGFTRGLKAEDLDSIEFSTGKVLICKMDFPIAENVTSENAEKRAKCKKKKYTVLMQEEELKMFSISKVIRKAVALHFVDRLKAQVEYKIEGHGWLESLSAIEFKENENNRFLKIDVELLMPAE